MASDGLLFPIFGQISSKSRTPVYSTVIGGIFAAVMALVFDLFTLIEMLSIGTLIAYTQVAVAVLISRYETNERTNSNLMESVLPMILIIFLLCTISIKSFEQLDYIDPISAICFIVLLGVLFLLIYNKFYLQQQNRMDDLERVFLVPYVPWLPVLSISCNIYLMLKLSVTTWIRFFIWMTLGFSVYFFYGIQSANEILFSVFI